MNSFKRTLNSTFYVFSFLLISSLILGACSEANRTDEKKAPVLETKSHFGLEYEILKDWYAITKSENGSESVTHYGNRADEDVEGFITIRSKVLSDSTFLAQKNDYVDGMSEAYKKAFESVKISMVQVDNEEALSVAFETENNDKVVHRKIIAFYANSKEYFIDFSCYSKDYKKGIAVYEALIKSVIIK